MQSASGPGATIVHVSPKSHTILQQNNQHILLSKLASDSTNNRPATSGVEASLLQTTHSNNSQSIYPAHYIEAIAEQTVYPGNGESGGIVEIKSGTPLRKLFASVTKSVSGQYQEYTPIMYAPISGGQTYYHTANGQVLATTFGSTGTTGHTGSLHAAATHTNLSTGHAQLVTHQGATYLVHGTQLDDDTSAISHTAKASPVTVQWLVDNYETAEGVSLPRSTLYFHYLQHCNEHKLEPMNPASFGKLIRSVFYGLRTRRLGTRGNSKYHYYGIRIKPNSPLNHFIEDAGFSLRHYPNYHRQTMEAAAEWKSFTNSSSLNRLKSLSGNNANSNNNNNNNNNDTIGQNNLTSQLNNIHSTSHINNSQLSHYNTSSILRTEKSYINNSYTSGNILSSSSGSQNTENITTTQSLCSPVLLSSGQHHTQFLGEASSALPNLDEICRSSGLPVPSEVDITAENSSGKNRLKTDSSTDTLMNEDVITFCRLYALSAGYMLDAVINLDFTAIETVWKAFWCTEEIRDSRLKQSLSQEQLFSLVSDPAILQFVRLYDHTFYQSLAEVLIPNVLRPIPPSLTQTIRNFAKSLEGWMRQATQGLDSALVGLKVSAVSALAQTLRRYTSLNHLAQAARAVLKNVNQINQMLADLNRVDFNNVHEQASWVCQCSDATVSQLEHDFKRILQKHASLEEWAQWLDTVVTSILQPLEGNSLAYTRAAHQLVLKWSFYSSMVIRDLTLRSASSFGSFHLIRLLYDEYIFYLVEHKVAAHLGMTPVAVMGEMGRDITQQYFAQTRLHCDLINRRDPVKSSKGNNTNNNNNNDQGIDDLNSSSIKCSNPISSPQQYDSSYTSISLNITKEGNNNDHGDHVDAGGGGGGVVDNDDDHVNQSVEHRIDNITDIEDVDNNDDDDFDEEIDEYVDDEEDVDDSLGDENAMLKEAHASAQAYCRNSTNSIFQSLNTSSSNTIEYKLEIIQQTNVDNNEKDIDNGLLIHSTENTTEKDTTQKKDNNNDKNDDNDEVDKERNLKIINKSEENQLNINKSIISLPIGSLSNQQSEKDKSTRSCSPPSILTMPNPVRKVVRVTTFCDSRQQSINSPLSNSFTTTTNTTTITTRPISLKQASSSSSLSVVSISGSTTITTIPISHTTNSNEIIPLDDSTSNITTLPSNSNSSSSGSSSSSSSSLLGATTKITVISDTLYAKRPKLL